MTITWEQVLAFLCEDQTMAITSLLFLAFFAAVALINYALPRVLRPHVGEFLLNRSLRATFVIINYMSGKVKRFLHFFA